MFLLDLAILQENSKKLCETLSESENFDGFGFDINISNKNWDYLRICPSIQKHRVFELVAWKNQTHSEVYEFSTQEECLEIIKKFNA